MEIDAVALDVAGVSLGCDGGARECPGAIASLFSAVREFLVVTGTAPPGSVCSLPPGSLSDAINRVAPSGGVTPASKGSLSRAGPACYIFVVGLIPLLALPSYYIIITASPALLQ